jgi:release factor glutamine methyltransferase
LLEPEVAQHDPDHALYGGVDGMAIIIPIAGRAAHWLAAGGLLAIEHDDSTAAATVAAIAATSAFTDITSRRDLTERPRFVTARKVGRTPL